MASVPTTYSKQLSLPKAFPRVLTDLTREILREQPDDLESFCLNYFKDGGAPNVPERRNSNSSTSDSSNQEPRTASADSVEEDDVVDSILRTLDIPVLIQDLFFEADADRNGWLNKQEFKNVMENLGTRLGFKENDVRHILAEADIDQDGRVSYEEFMGPAINVIEGIVAKWALQKNMEEKEDAFKAAEHEVVHGIPEDELEDVLQRIFLAADRNGNGYLDSQEFELCLRDTELGLTRKEINILRFYADENSDGRVQYEEFRPLCKELLIELKAQEWLLPPQDEQEIAFFLMDLFRSNDEANTGVLPFQVVQELMHSADMGLNRAQICAIMSEVEEQEDSMVPYERFVPKAAFMALTCQNYRDLVKQHISELETLRASEKWTSILGMSSSEMEETLYQAFAKYDEDGVARMPRESAVQAVREALVNIDSDKKLNAVMALAKPDPDTPGYVFYEPVVVNTFPTLQKLAELELLANSVNN